MASRYIRNTEKKKIEKVSRNRCCVSGHIIIEDEHFENLAAATLEKHHIIYISEGGVNTEDNIIVVCANCHATIHSRPDLYPIEKLKEAKSHWENMEKFIPKEIIYPVDNTKMSDCNQIWINFSVVSLNLDYKLYVPDDINTNQLTVFIREWILRPLTWYSRLSPYNRLFESFKLEETKLFLKKHLDSSLKGDLNLRELDINPEDIFIAKADIQLVQYLAKTDFKNKLGKVKLTWEKHPFDLDIHLRMIHNEHEIEIFYRKTGDISQYPFAALDKDIQTGYGPETITFGALSKAKYKILVHNFSNDLPLRNSNAIVELSFIGLFKEFYCPSVGNGRWWVVCEIDMTASDRVIPINEILDSE